MTAQIDEPSGQVIEDSALLAIGQPPPPRLDLPLPEVVAMQQAAETALAGEADVSLVSPTLAIRPGGTGAIEVLVRNRTAVGHPRRGAAHLAIRQLARDGAMDDWLRARPPADQRPCGSTCAIPATARPGEQWWAIVKVMYFGRLPVQRAGGGHDRVDQPEIADRE